MRATYSGIDNWQFLQNDCSFRALFGFLQRQSNALSKAYSVGRPLHQGRGGARWS